MAPAVSRPPSRSSQVSSDGEGDDMGRRPSSQCVTPRVEGTGRSGSPVHRANLPFSQQSSQQRVLPLHKPYENLKQFMNGEAFGPCLSDPNVKETESRPCKLSSMFVRGFSRGV
ncbi:unnamed protein product [Cladocopium goreaui]|uniref:Uncharacterized protein n=1 Tax=Cladocopium goreaui TaxID=2562237 RepID=A0A9P1DVK7_9DINO|nr:unnamed protein product [Cladocopium goreaui]